MKCSAGTTAMDNELDCSKQGLNNWKDFVAKVERSLSGFKNPYDTSKSAVMVEVLQMMCMLDLTECLPGLKFSNDLCYNPMFWN